MLVFDRDKQAPKGWLVGLWNSSVAGDKVLVGQDDA